MIFQLAKMYSYLYGVVKDHFGVHLPGLGFVLRRVRTDRIITVMGRKMFFNHKISGSYARPISGSWNEIETHFLLNYLISNLPNSVTFIDVGANIGEMVIDVSRHEKVHHIIAFEPISDCCNSIKESLNLNGFINYTIIEKLVGAEVGYAKFSASKDPQTSSVISNESHQATNEVAMTTLDIALPVISDDVIMLVDVEGYEPSVLKGAANFIKAKQPLIIFEYNSVSKSHFTVSDIKEILGCNWDIYRLRQDGHLDDKVENAWNCVAIHNESTFKSISLPLIVQA